MFPVFHYVPPGSDMFLLCSLFVPLCSIEEKNSSNKNSKGKWNTMEHDGTHQGTRSDQGEHMEHTEHGLTSLKYFTL